MGARVSSVNRRIAIIACASFRARVAATFSLTERRDGWTCCGLQGHGVYIVAHLIVPTLLTTVAC